MGRYKLMMSAVMLASLLTVGSAVYMLPERSMSENENRVLQSRPKFTLESLLDTSYQKQLGDYLSDQFPARESIMAAGTKMKLLAGLREIKDTYVGKDGYYFEKVTDQDIDQVRWEKNLNRIENLAQKYPEIRFGAMFVPAAGIVMNEKLPAYAELYNYKGMLEAAEKMLPSYHVINPLNELVTSKLEDTYYHTDHHWTTYGAYQAYQVMMNGKGTYDISKLTKVSDHFLGTLYSRTMDADAAYDSVSIAPLEETIQTTINGDPGKMYDESALQRKDKYQIFFGGNHGIVEITSGKGKGTLLVLKDSFANSMVPFLTNEYEKIVMVDLRYYAGSVQQLLNQGGVDEVLVLYEMSNFANDTNLAKLSM